MNTNVVIGLVALLVVGAGTWYLTSQDASETGTGTSGEVQEEMEQEERAAEDAAGPEGLGTFMELMALGQSFTCDFRAENPDVVSEGTVYIDGGGERYKLDGSFAQDGESGTFSMIADGQVMYWWGDTPEGQMGMRMRIPEEESPGTLPESFDGTSGAVSPEEEVAYDCDPWRADASVFAPPSDVEFTDMDAMFEEMMEGMPEGFDMPANMQQ